MLGLRVNRRRNFENAGVKGVAFSPEIVIERVWKNSTFVIKKKTAIGLTADSFNTLVSESIDLEKRFI